MCMFHMTKDITGCGFPVIKGKTNKSWYVLMNRKFDESRDDLPDAIYITDPPYNQRYGYSSYADNLSDHDYIRLLSNIPKPCVLIHYPEETINVFPKIWGVCDEVMTWVYNSNTGKQSRLISWWGCKPDFRKVGQDYKNPNDKRIRKLIDQGKKARLYDWVEMQQIKNTSAEKENHPCQIPEELMKMILQMTVKPGQIVVDPFLGSGTTGTVAVELGMNFWGYEMDAGYFRTATERMWRKIGSVPIAWNDHLIRWAA